MVKNTHQNGRLRPCFAGMVSKCLAQGMAADFNLKMQFMPRVIQYAEGLAAA